jgi:hypothetical protein
MMSFAFSASQVIEPVSEWRGFWQGLRPKLVGIARFVNTRAVVVDRIWPDCISS